MKCEICSEETNTLDKHHIQSKSKGGNNKKYNICLLCPNCHRKVHLGEIILEGKFMTTLSYQLIFHYKNNDKILDEVLPEVHLFLTNNHQTINDK